MLKMTGVKLETISDIDKYLLIEKGLRGGISYIDQIRTKANNKYMNDYDPKKPPTFISQLFYIMNNLYGWVYEEFKWLKNVDEFDVMSISEKGYIFSNLALNFLIKQLHSFSTNSRKTCCFQ